MIDNRNMLALLGDPKENTHLDYVEKFFDWYSWMSPRDRLATALWTMHMHVYNQFRVTPRLALLSPDPGWGKTVGLDLIRHLAPRDPWDGTIPDLTIDPTPASLYQLVDNGATALMLDEVDNLNLKSNGKLRVILNANIKGTSIPRGGNRTKGEPRAKPKLFYPFIPIAVAAIGRLPKPMTTRCIAIHMRKKPPGIFLEKIDNDPVKFKLLTDAMHEMLYHWANNIVLPHQVITGVDNRFEDNWKPMVAIADHFGQGDKARSIAKVMCGEAHNHSEGTQLLIHIRLVFDVLGVDRIDREVLLTELHKFDEWNEWGRAHLLTRNELSAFIRNYHIPPAHTIQRKGSRVERGPSEWGWYRSDFEEAWQSLPE